jgi:hypothetical protein
MKYIIGGGITGLVWKWYHPDYHIISPEAPGGLYAKTYMVWLHKTAETIKLLRDLGWVNPERMTKKSYIGYCHDWISDYQSEELNLEIIKRKMTPWNEPIDDSFVPKSRDLSMSTSSGESYMNTLDVDLEEVIRRLGEKANIENGFVTKITDKEITVQEKWQGPSEVRPYDSVITTMAAPLFWKAYGDIGLQFRSAPITNVVVSKCPKMYDSSYDMVYYTRKYPFSRISYLRGKYAIEFTGEMTREQFEAMFPDLPIEDIFVVKHGRIWENDAHVSPQDNIVFSGRFSQWKYKIVTECVVKQSIDHV